MAAIGGVGRISSDQLGLLRNLSQISRELSKTAERLSTFKRINRASDDPSGLVMATRLQSELETLASTSGTITRAQSLIDTADAAATDIVSKLTDARVLALHVAGGSLTAAEKTAKQVQLDDILDSIDRTAKTSFNGLRLLDGSAGYRVSGVNTTSFLDVDVLAKRTTSDVSVTVDVTTTALQGAKAYAGGTLGSATTLEVSGSEGTTTLELANGATTQDITDAFNAVSYLTGVTATRVDATNITFATTTYGSAATIAITATAGTFTTTGTGTGRDAIATVNGTSVTADGTAFTANLPNVAVQFDIAPAASGALTAFTVSGNGLSFNLSSDPNDTARIGIANLSSSTLGGSAGKLSSLRSGHANAIDTGDALDAIAVLDQAISEAQIGQARLGSFSKYQLDSAASLNAVQEETTTAAYNDIMSVDVAEETARLSQQQLLQSAATQALQVSMLQGASVLSILQNIALR